MFRSDYFRIVLNGEVYSKKNSKTIAKFKDRNGFIHTKVISSKQYLVWEKSAVKQLLVYKSQYQDWHNNVLVYPLRIHFYIVRKTNRQWDWLNLMQGPLDALVKAGFIPDDSAIYVLPVFDGWEVDKNNPHLIIKIFNGG